MTTVEIGYERRHWVSLTIKDATPKEVALLRQHEQGDYVPEVFEMLNAMDAAGRLSYSDDSSEDMPQYFAQESSPNIIGVEEE